MSIPIQELTVVYHETGRTQKAAQILLYGYCVATPIGYFYSSKDYALQASLCSALAYS